METPVLSLAYAPVLVPGSRCLLGEPHVRLIALFANNFDLKWVMRQVGHADSKMTIDVYAQLEQRLKRDHGASFERLVRWAPEFRGEDSASAQAAELVPKDWPPNRPLRGVKKARSKLVIADLGGRGSADEVGLIDHGCGLTGGDADEDASVHPVESGGGGLDLG